MCYYVPYRRLESAECLYSLCIVSLQKIIAVSLILSYSTFYWKMQNVIIDTVSYFRNSVTVFAAI